MKSASVFGCLFISLCLVRSTESNIGDFLSNLPTEIGNAFVNAWNTVVDAIRRPVRIKRLGPGGKRKTTTTTTTSTTTTIAPVETVKPVKLYPSINGLKVPVIPTPQWLTIEDWKDLQKPRFVKVQKHGKDLLTIPASVIDDFEMAPIVTDPSNLDEENNFGVLFFI